jgi:hypothetical protein
VAPTLLLFGLPKLRMLIVFITALFERAKIVSFCVLDVLLTKLYYIHSMDYFAEI